MTTLDNVRIRPATADDLELLMAWRSHPEVYEGAFEQDGPLWWEDHSRWWDGREGRHDWITIVEEHGQPRRVGSVAARQVSPDSAVISVYVGEVTVRRRGVGRESVRLAMEELKSLDRITYAIAHIIDGNDRSIRLFKSLGFTATGKGEGGQHTYKANLHDHVVAFPAG